MQKIRLKDLLTSLTTAEKCDLLVVYMHWMNQQFFVDVAREGCTPLPGGVEAFTSSTRATIARLEGDAPDEKSLRIGVANIFQGLSIMQRESIGPKLNVFFRAHLPERVFLSLYTAAGLDTDTLRYDPDFPTDLLSAPGASQTFPQATR